MNAERWRQVDAILKQALEREGCDRATFLDAACANDSSLRGEVEALIRSYEQAGSFLEAGPDIKETITSVPISLSGRALGHYIVKQFIGSGGMGEVYLAEDNRLGRRVAIKLLPAEFTADAERVRRFAREARAASALNHPNIITIHEIGELESTHYIVTEYVEGETLRQRMKAAPQQRMKPADAIDIAAQVAAALTAAHDAGITHRDIKPENVMVRRDDIVKVLDFGLAKLTETQAAPVDSTVEKLRTETGVVIGTPRYMSPEQARGENVDPRTDIFSVGVMLYEMVAGHTPFGGATTSETIAAILRDEPPPLADDAPPELERIVSRALRKDRTERHQTAKDLLADLKELKQRIEVDARPGEPALRVSPEGGNSNARPRLATIIAVAAFILAAIAGLVLWRTYFDRPPTLTEKDTILLADFENKTSEEIFNGMLKQGLAIQLQQSPFLNLFPEAQMRHELSLMKRPPNERVTAEVAREICERQNLKAFIAGSIVPLGSHYVITLEVFNGQGGETLAREQEQAKSKEQVLEALSQAATRVREQLGESLSSIQRFNRPLGEGTTADTRAFKAFSQGGEIGATGRIAESIPFFLRAVELDSDFAVAHAQLAIMYVLTDQPALAARYAKKAYELQDRTSEIEKFRIAQIYQRIANGDLNRSIEALQLSRRTYPREPVGPNDLALCYNLTGQYEQAIPEARECIRLNPQFAAPYRNLALALLGLNRFGEVKEAIVQARQRGLDHRDFYFCLYQLSFINSDKAGMQQQIEGVKGKPYEYVTLDWQTGAAAFAGQWRKAQETSRRAIEITTRAGKQEAAGRYAAEQALRGALFGECPQAKADAGQGLKLARGPISLSRAALAFALCSETKQALPLVEELRKVCPEDTLIKELWLPAIRAALELQRGNAKQSIEQLQATSSFEAAAEFWPQYLRGQAHLKLKRGPEAATEFQKILDHRGYAPLSPLYSLGHLGLARAAALAGDAVQRGKAYEDFFAMWKEADPDLSSMIQAKKEFERK